jgi:hypothetical protein
MEVIGAQLDKALQQISEPALKSFLKCITCDLGARVACVIYLFLGVFHLCSYSNVHILMM